MDVFSLRTSAFQDERNRLSLLPTAVKLTHGNVSGAELLLRDAPTQAVLGSAGGCRMGDVVGALRDLRSYWGGMLQMGATSFWEDFDLKWMENAGRINEVVPEGKKDIHGDYGAFCYEKFRHSLCHGWSSGPVPYAARHILGITILEPGCKKLSIVPHLGDLAYARGTYPTPLGVVTVSHEKQPDGTVKTEVDAPEGMEIVVG